MLPPRRAAPVDYHAREPGLPQPPAQVSRNRTKKQLSLQTTVF
jgi:hypothetical protein